MLSKKENEIFTFATLFGGLLSVYTLLFVFEMSPLSKIPKTAIEALISYVIFFLFYLGFIFLAKKEKNKFLEYSALLLIFLFIVPENLFLWGGESFNGFMWISPILFIFGFFLFKLKRFGIYSKLAGSLSILSTFSIILNVAGIIPILAFLSQSYILYRAREVYNKK